MKKKKQEHKILTKEIVVPALKRMFIKLHFKHMRKNIVMFTVEISFIITLALTFLPNLISPPIPAWFNIIISFLLFATVLFANFAEAIAEGRGEAQAEFLKTLLTDTKARKVIGLNKFEMIDAKLLQKGDTVVVYPGEIIPMDGEIIKGKTTIDESAITGESMPVTKEVGEDTSSVTGGTKVISDEVTILINVDKGSSFLDKMINLVEESERQRTPNEQALNIILIGLTIVFFVVIVTLIPITKALGIQIGLPILIALFVCLIPTTIGGLLSAIGIAGMNRVTEYNVIAMSGKAVELCGDVTAIILDKTGTITYGTRMPYEFIPIKGVAKEELLINSYYTSVHDATPEGKSITHRCHELLHDIDESPLKRAEIIKFSANSKMSGINTFQRDEIRKGSNKTIKMFVTQRGGIIPDELDDIVSSVANNAGTPLVVCKNNIILGVIHLKDTIKPGLVERFDELHQLGIKTIMCTGDNELTARAIAKEAHVDDYVAECKPEDKINVIKNLQSEGLIVAMTGDGTNDAPALAVADIGIAMNSGTTAAKEAANMVDLDSDPTKILNIIDIGKELLITRGALTTFSIANDIAKYFAIIPAIFASQLPNIGVFNIMNLSSPYSAIISAVLFNAIIIPLLIPIAIKGVSFSAKSSKHLLIKNMLVFGVGGIIAPFIGIKIIDMIVYPIITLLFM